MTDELSSTNINDIINEVDTEINDDVVDKILNELEQSDTDTNNINENNDFRNDDFGNDDFRNNDFRNDDFRNDDFRNDDFRNNNLKNENESENTINKINTILNLDTDYNFSIINFIFNDFKNSIIVIIIILLINNNFVTDFLYNIISKLINSDIINNNISLTMRALVSGILFYLIEKFI